MARIERATSPLPRECSTTEPHGHRHRTGRRERADQCRLISNHLERETGIEPVSSAWKAEVLPLNYSRLASQICFRQKQPLDISLGGGGWIRTSVGVSQQIYSLPPLATRAPLRRISNYSRIFSANSRERVQCNINSCGAAGGDRTHDPWLRRPILYPLSYSRCGTDGCNSIFHEPAIIARLMSCRPTPARTRPDFLFIIS